MSPRGNVSGHLNILALYNHAGSSVRWTDSSSDDELVMLPVIIAAFDDSESEDDEPGCQGEGLC